MTNFVDQCGVCLEDRNQMDFEFFQCGHKLCKICYPRLTNWTCPFCRSALPRPIPNSQNQVNDDHFSDLESYFGYDMAFLDRDLRQRDRRRERRERRRRRRINRIPVVNIVSDEDVVSEDNSTTTDDIMTQLVESYLDNDPDKELQRRRNLRSNSWNYRRNQQNISHSW